MSTNQVYDEARKLSLAVTDPVAPASGDPVLVGQIPGVALTAARADGTTTIDTAGVYNLTVNAVDGVGNSAVAVGDILYYTAADVIKLAKKNAGVRFGYALDALAAGANGVIRVKVGY